LTKSPYVKKYTYTLRLQSTMNYSASFGNHGTDNHLTNN